MQVNIKMRAVGGSVGAVLQIMVREGSHGLERAIVGVDLQNVGEVGGYKPLRRDPVD